MAQVRAPEKFFTSGYFALGAKGACHLYATDLETEGLRMEEGPESLLESWVHPPVRTPQMILDFGRMNIFTTDLARKHQNVQACPIIAPVEDDASLCGGASFTDRTQLRICECSRDVKN